MSIPSSVAAALLSYAAATDNREVTEEAARAWANSLHHTVTIQDGRTAIDTHRADSAEWLMPVHVNQNVKAVRSARIANVTAPAPPVPLDVDQDIAWRRAYITARADGLDRQGAQDRANREHGITPPDAPEIPPPTPRLHSIAPQMADVPYRRHPDTQHEDPEDAA